MWAGHRPFRQSSFISVASWSLEKMHFIAPLSRNTSAPSTGSNQPNPRTISGRSHASPLWPTTRQVVQGRQGKERGGQNDGTKKGKNEKGCEQGKGWRQVCAGHASAFRAAAEKLLPGSGIYAPVSGARLFCTLTSNAGGKDSLPGKANTRFHRLRHPKNPMSPRLVCRGSDLSL